MSGVAVAQPPGLPGRVVLDRQETMLIRLFAEGLVLEAIARRMDISERTVRRRLRALCDRIGVETPVQVAVWASRAGVL